MSSFQEFLHSRILRHPTTWFVIALAGGLGGIDMYGRREARRAAGAELQTPWLWLDRIVDAAFGATFEIVLVLCAVWLVAGLFEHSSAWLRQLAFIAAYLVILLVKYFYG